MKQFCYWQIFKDIDFYLIIGVTTIGFLIFLYSMIYFVKIFKNRQKIQKQIIFVYLFCIMWSVLYMLKNVYSLWTYANELRSKKGGYMVKQSQIFCGIDSLPTFFLQGLLIFIPYLWLKNISNFLQKMKRNQKKDKIITKIFQIYLYLRNVIYLTLLCCELFLNVDQYNIEYICNSIIICIIIQSFLSLCLLAYGILKLEINFKSINQQDQQSKKKFRNQYLIMIGCSLIRFILDFYFILYEQVQSDDMQSCFNSRKQDYMYTIVYLIIGSILMHLLPISMILKIYQIDFQRLKQNALLQGDY